MKCKIIGCDMDSVLNDLNTHWVNYLNKAYQFNVKPYDVVEWDMRKAFPDLSTKRIYAPLYLDSFWETIAPYKGSINGIKQLMQLCDEIVIVTNSHPITLYTKILWLKKYFPFLPDNSVIITAKKQLINMDILIDDYEVNLIGGQYHKILLDYPYNRKINDQAHGIHRVYNWDGICKVAEKLLNGGIG